MRIEERKSCNDNALVVIKIPKKKKSLGFEKKA